MSNTLQPHGLQYTFTVSQNLLKFMSIESVMLSNHLILCHSLLFLPSISPSIRVFSSESTLCLRWPKYWVFSFSISLSNEYSGLISFRIDWFDIFAVQRTLKSLPHHHNLKASITSTWPSLWLTIALTRQTFVGSVVSAFLIHCRGLSWFSFQGASVF